MWYVAENADSIETSFDKNGKQIVSRKYTNKENEYVKVIKLTKKWMVHTIFV